MSTRLNGLLKSVEQLFRVRAFERINAFRQEGVKVKRGVIEWSVVVNAYLDRWDICARTRN